MNSNGPVADLATRSYFRLALLAALGLCITAVWLASWQLQRVPAVGFDEWMLLARPDRAGRYQDTSDKVILNHFAENGRHSKFPPLQYGARVTLHALTGWTVSASRWISLVEFVLLAVLIGWSVWRAAGGGDQAPARHGANGAMLFGCLAAALFLSLPIVTLNARSVRLEQDTLFVGGLSLVVLAAASTLTRRAHLAFLAAGCLAATAACIHLNGSMFVVAAMLYGLNQLVWSRRNQRAHVAAEPPFRPGLWWLTGASVPVLVTVAYYAADWHNSAIFFQGLRQFEKVHTTERTRIIAGSWCDQPLLVRQGAGAVSAACQVWFPYPASGRLATVVWGLGWFWAVAVAGLVVAALFGLGTGRAWGQGGLGVWLAALVAVTIQSVVYPPNSDYVVYPAAVAAVAGCLLLARAQRSLSSFDGAPRVIGMALASLLFSVVIAQQVYLYSVLKTVGRRSPATAADQVAAMEKLAAWCGLEPDRPDGLPVYGDTTSWAGATRRLTPLSEYLIFEVDAGPRPCAGVVCSLNWYNRFVVACAPFTGEPIDPDRRRLRFAQLVSSLHLSGVLLTLGGDGSVADARLWLTASRAPLVVAMQRPRGPVAWYRALEESTPEDDLPGQSDNAALTISREVARGTHSLTVPVRVPAGRYLAVVTGASVVSSALRIEVAGQRIIGHPAQNFAHVQAGAVACFEVPYASAEAATAMVEATLTQPGPVQLRLFPLAELCDIQQPLDPDRLCPD